MKHEQPGNRPKPTPKPPKKKFATGGLVPMDAVFPTMGMTERAWWKCKKCGVTFEAWSNPPLHKCTRYCLDDDDLAGR